MLKRLVNEARLSLTIESTGPLLIKSGYATLTGPDMTPVLTYRYGGSQVYVPGSSLKGAFRSHLEKVVRTVRPNDVVVADPFKRDNGPDQSCSAWFDARHKKKPLDDETVYADSDPIARLFGSTHFIGRIGIGDAYLLNEKDEYHKGPGYQSHIELRDGVGIDRWTGGAANQALFNMAVVVSGTRFRTDIALRNFECWQLGALMLIVMELQDGFIRLGSGKSRGLGSVKGHVSEVALHYPSAGSTRPDTDVWGLGKFLGNGSYGTWPDDYLEALTCPETARHGIRAIQIFKEQALQDLQQRSIQDFIQRIEAFPVYKQRKASLA